MLKAERSARAQSAMEYLMTYGWSILLIAIVIAAIFELGVFNSNPLSSSSTCLAQSGFLCTKPVLNSTGILNLTFGQSYGTTYTITGVACTNSTNPPSSFIPVSPIVVYTGSSAKINFNCPISSGAIGTPFSGTLWIQYNTTRLTGQIAKIATANLKVVTSSPQGGSGVGAQNLYPSLLSVPITLVNMQSSGTGSNFQEMLSINSNLYSAYINSGWSNVEFTTGNVAAGNVGTTLQAWVESGATNTATNTIVWVNLPGGIPATSSTTIYLNVLTGNVMSASGPTGEAPQLSTTYAKYDNGAGVFNFYDNFAGNTLSSKWGSIVGSGTVTVSNGLTFNPTAQMDLPTSASYSYPQIFETDTLAYSSGGGNYRVGEATTPNGDGSGVIYPGYETSFTSTAVSGDGQSACCGGFAWGSTTGISSAVGIASIAWTALGAQKGGLNYGWQLSASNTLNTIANYYFFVFAYPSGATNPSIQWARSRSYPPNGIAPSQNTGVAVPSQIVHYVPITLTNSQSSADAAGTQIMVPFNANAYTSNEASNMQNVEFFYGNGTVMPSWLEGNVANEAQTANIYTATNDIYWVLIAPSIAASGGTQTIYAGFAPTNTNLFNGVTVGEAPQLSTTYAQYDNGASIFQNYWNFAGGSLPSSWQVVTGSSYTVTNGILFGISSATNLATTAKYPINSILESDFNIPSTGNHGILTYVLDSSGNPYTNPSYINLGGAPGQFYSGVLFDTRTGTAYSLNANLASYNTVAITTSTGVNVVGVVSLSGSSNFYYDYAPYQLTLTVPALGNYYIEVGSPQALSLNWIRTRTYPPSGVLPAVSFGAFV